MIDVDVRPVMSPWLEQQLRELLATGTTRIALTAPGGVVTSVSPATAQGAAAERIADLERALAHSRGIADAERRRAELLEATRRISWRAAFR